MSFMEKLIRRLAGPHGERVRRLTALQNKYFIEKSYFTDFGRYVRDELNYLQRRRFFGNDLLKTFGIRTPTMPKSEWGIPGLVAQLGGFDLDAEYHRSPDAGVTICGMRLPGPPEGKGKTQIYSHEMNDVVLPSLLRSKIKNFDDIYETIYDLYLDRIPTDFDIEGPYEIGENVCLASGDVVIDCGANMGLFSAVAAHAGCHAYAFEAIPSVIDDYLSGTASLYPGQIMICPYAVWDENGKLTFDINEENIGASTGVERLRDENKKHVEVDAITLDDFVERREMTKVDFIKADIEGAERNMLRGAKNVLRTFAPKLSICTYHLPDDPCVLREIILDANPNYRIVEQYKKMYAYVPKADGKERVV